MTGKELQALRKRLGENTQAFGGRFLRSGRTVEDWEQERRQPDKLALRLLIALDKRTAGKDRS